MQRTDVAAELAAAITAGSLSLEYQPLVDLRSYRVNGMEALARWWVPAEGWRPPDHWIPVAEERGLIGKEIGVEKLVWGSDCRDEEIGEHVERLHAIFGRLGLTEDERDRILYRNAAEMFGEVEPQIAQANA